MAEANPDTPTIPEDAKSRQEVDNRVSVEVISHTSRGGIQPALISDVLRDFNDQGIRGALPMRVIGWVTQNFERELINTRSDLDKLRDQHEKLRDDYFKLREKNRVLREKNSIFVKLKVLQTGLTTLGGLIAGAGIKPILEKQNLTSVTLGCIVLGAVLLFLGWLWPTWFRDKDEDDERVK